MKYRRPTFMRLISSHWKKMEGSSTVCRFVSYLGILLLVAVMVPTFADCGGGEAGGSSIEIVEETTKQHTGQPDAYVEKMIQHLPTIDEDEDTETLAEKTKTLNQVWSILPDHIKIKYRQQINVAEQRAADWDSSKADVAYATLATLDKTGQAAQFVLSYTPGVGSTVATSLDAVRASAAAYDQAIQQGATREQAASAAAQAGVVSGALSYGLSKIPGDKILGDAIKPGPGLGMSGKNVVQRGAQVFTGLAIEGGKMGVQAGATKEVIKASIRQSASDKSLNNAKQTGLDRYVHDKTPVGQKMYH